MNVRSGFDLKELRAFVAVAEANGFRRASRQMELGQSVVSARVRNLEDALGVSLLERHRAGVRLTRAGGEFLVTVRSVLAELDYGARRAALAGKGANGHLRLGIFASLASGFPREAIKAFKVRHPEVSIEVFEGAPRDHLIRIREHRLDLTWVTGLTRNCGLRSEQMWTERVALAVAADHQLAHSEYLSWDRLSDQRFIVSREEPGPEIYDWLVPRLTALGRQADIVRTSVARESLLVLVGLGFGVTVVSEAATGVCYPGVAFRWLEREEDLLPFHAAWSDENDNPALRRFLSLMRAMAQDRDLPDPPLTY